MIKLSSENVNNFIEYFKNEMTIFENIKGDDVYVKIANDNTISLRTKNKITIDPSMRIFYKPILDIFENLNESALELCRDKTFSVIMYDNYVILKGYIKDSRLQIDYVSNQEYAKLLGIRPLPIIFEGILSHNQLDIIKRFLYTSPADLKYLFKDDIFSNFFIRLLNVSYKDSILNGSDQDSLMIRINNDNISFSIINPLYDSTEKNTNFVEISSILLADFISYIQGINIDRRILSGVVYEDIYIDMICNLFNEYIEYRKDRLDSFEFEVPDSECFMVINTELIDNEFTKELIDRNESYMYMFHNIYNKMNSYMSEPYGVIENKILEIFNNTVKSFMDVINRALYIGNEQDIIGMINIKDVYNIQYPTDGEGKVYINKTDTDTIDITDKKGKNIDKYKK